jgi:alkylation response protein AidB-like acyl-CoA dehydrogenase
VTEELLRAGAPIAAHWIGDRQIGPAILRHGSEELRAEILPGTISADFIFSLGLATYQSARSDLRTTLDLIASHMPVVGSTADSEEALLAFRETRAGHFTGA